jgi:hypothetical protein
MCIVVLVSYPGEKYVVCLMQAGSEELLRATDGAESSRLAAEDALSVWSTADAAVLGARGRLQSEQQRLDEEVKRLEGWKQQVPSVSALALVFGPQCNMYCTFSSSSYFLFLSLLVLWKVHWTCIG